MKVKELIKKLESFPPELEVTITDGHEGTCYATNVPPLEIREFEDTDGSIVIDMGIGGNRIN